MKLTKALSVLALAIAVAAPAYAETQNVKVSGSIDMYGFRRTNLDLLDNNDAGVVALGSTVPAQSHGASALNRSESDSFFFTITQLQVAAGLTDNVSAVINLINQRDWNSNQFNTTASPTRTAGDNVAADEYDINLDLAYVEMKEIFYSPLTFRIGRQDLLFGRGFIVGWNPQDPQNIIQADEFTQIQSFDALRATLDFSPWTVDLVYSKIDENNPNPEDDRDLWIGNVGYKFAEYNAVAEGYYVGEIDRGTVSGTSGAFNNETDTFGIRAQFDPISQITLGGEVALQIGQYRSLITSPTRDRNAWAADLFGEYRFDNQWKPMVGLEYVHLSGDEDLGTNSTTEYKAWNGPFRGPTYGWIHEYLETYYATAQADDQSAGQNHDHINLYGNIRPLNDLLLTGSWYYLWAPERVHQTAGVLTSPSENDNIGNEINTSVVYSYTTDVTFSFMANWFIPGKFYNTPNNATASEYISEVKVTF